jgi:hypothetical protein
MTNAYREQRASIINIEFIHEFFLHYDVVYDDNTKMIEMTGRAEMEEVRDKIPRKEHTVPWSCELISMLLDYQLPLGRTFLLIPEKIWSELHRYIGGINLINASVLFFPHNGEHVCLMNMLEGQIHCVAYLIGIV